MLGILRPQRQTNAPLRAAVRLAVLAGLSCLVASCSERRPGDRGAAEEAVGKEVAVTLVLTSLQLKAEAPPGASVSAVIGEVVQYPGGVVVADRAVSDTPGKADEAAARERQRFTRIVGEIERRDRPGGYEIAYVTDIAGIVEHRLFALLTTGEQRFTCAVEADSEQSRSVGVGICRSLRR